MLTVKRTDKENEEAGVFPFRRGIYPEMYKKKLWTMRQYAGFSSSISANERFKSLLANGATGLSIAFDLPTQMGLDPDHELALGEVGKAGVNISTMEDFREMLEGISLGNISISMTINSTSVILYSMLLLLAEEREVSFEQLRGTIQNDILKEHIARNTNFLNLQRGLKLSLDVVEYADIYTPKFYPISVSGYHIREAGSSLVDELAFSFSNAITYLEHAKQKGLNLENLVSKFSFFYSIDSSFFEEVAKLRAARVLWANILTNRFQIKDKAKCALKFHCQTAGSSLKANDILGNISRTTLQSLVAIFGGCQSLHTSSYDEAHCLPSEESAKQSLEIQKILSSEFGITSMIDPFGGSSVIEELTDKIILETKNRIDQINSIGGMVKAIELDFPQIEIEKNSFKIYQKEQDLEFSNFSKKVKKLDLKNKYRNEELDIKGKIVMYKKSRSSDISKSLNNLKIALKEDKNSIPFIKEALRDGATLGEISGVLKH